MPLEPIGGSLHDLLEKMGLEASLRGWRALGHWAEVVGPRAAARSRAVAFEAGVLVVEVEGAVWMSQLGYLKRDIVSGLNDRLGGRVVTEIRFVPAPGG